MGCPLRADIERMEKTSSPSGLSTWGPYWQPKWAGEVGPRRSPYIRIGGLPTWGGHRARGQNNRAHLAVDVGPILAAQMGWGGWTWKEPIYTDRWAAHFGRTSSARTK